MTSRSPGPLVWIAIFVPVAVAVVGVYAVFFRGLGRKRPAPPPAAAVLDEDEAPFTYAKPRRKRMPVPARFDAPLPVTAEDFTELYDAGERFPPAGYVESRLCAGDERMFARLQTALDAAARGSERRRERIDRFAQLFGECDVRRPCAELRRRALDETLGAEAREVYWLGLAGCSKEPAATFERPDAPPRAVIDWHAERDPEGRPPWWPPLGRAVAQIAADGQTPPHELRMAVYELLRTHDPAGEEALLRADEAAASSELRVALGLAAGGARTSKARALYRRACRADPDDPACRDADEPREYDRGERPLARDPSEVDPEVAALRRRLLELGLVDAAADFDGDEETAYDFMAASRRAVWFDVETGMYPNQHDRLLADLAELVRPDLDGVIFEEVFPADPETDDDYQLRAYLDGVRYELVARNLEDWYDLEAVLGLLNALLRERKSARGCLTLHTGDQTAQVVCGPRAGLRTAVAEELLELEGAEEPVKLGKEFEDEVLRQLQDELRRR